MRVPCLLLTASIISATGCTMLVVNSGTNLAELQTREQVEKVFRQPAIAGQTDGQHFVEYTTHRKIAEPKKNIYLCTGAVATWGFTELLFFPSESYRAARRSVVGQRVRFTYDAEGRVTAIDFDDNAVRLPPRIETPAIED